jgi:hypothetical protein
MKTLPTLVLLAACLAGCAGSPPVSEEKRPEARLDKAEMQALPGVRRFEQAFEGLYVLAFEVDTHYSSLDKTSCYAFLTGTLTNASNQHLSRQTAVEFIVYHGDALLFRDYTYLRADLPAGGQAPINLLTSPTHKKQCPSYDRIDVALKKITLN